ncbi:MAG: hypothetical protein J0H92_01570 [Sphingobacteriales bacterium]|nr:hypothetical protein [Sphingobacteriales bacterium]OJW33344.1 MAG: hypothetical protein BGO54_08745 [Sphingobacteriales bacterium 46-32]
MLLGCQKENRSLSQFPDLESSVQFSLAEDKAWFDYKKQNELVSKRDEEGNLFSTARADSGTTPTVDQNCTEVKESMAGHAVSIPESISLISENTSAQTPTRTKAYVWVLYQQNWGLWSFSSHEEGVHKKNGTNWQWQSLTHKSISRSGLFAGGTVNCEVNTSIPEIGVYNAGMQLNYTITISVLCKGSPLGASGTYTTNSPIWNVND